MTSCRYCGASDAYDSGFTVECASASCRHYSPRQAALTAPLPYLDTDSPPSRPTLRIENQPGLLSSEKSFQDAAAYGVGTYGGGLPLPTEVCRCSHSAGWHFVRYEGGQVVRRGTCAYVSCPCSEFAP